ncbi:MAG TPA: hypothetical protein VFX73_01370 [Chitinophagaceae bacterium]|jgi:hypothetical protein|nr:hypothetical protein [Chitinophagaceae bacterium]
MGDPSDFFTAGFFCPKTGSIIVHKNNSNKKANVLDIHLVLPAY